MDFEPYSVESHYRSISSVTNTFYSRVTAGDSVFEANSQLRGGYMFANSSAALILTTDM